MHPQVLSVLMINLALFKVHQYPPNAKKTIVTNLHVTIPSANIFLGIYKLEHECTRLFTTFICKLDLNSQISQK